MADDPNTIKSEYVALESKRLPVLTRARECSKLTLPYIMPPEGHTETTELYKPYQSMGADGVKHLSSKLLLTLFPPGNSIVRLGYDEAAVEALEQQQQVSVKTQIEEKLSSLERIIMSALEAKGLRPGMFVAIKHLLITGNVLIFNPPKQEPKIFFLDNFVIQRDPRGNCLKIIVKECVDVRALSEAVRAQIAIKDADKAPDLKAKTVDLYTKIELSDDAKSYVVTQEAYDIKLDTGYTYPIDRNDWIPLRWSRIDGEDYGRSYVEEYLGDLISLETLSQAIVEGSAAAARILFLVNPNGTTTVKSLRDTKNGGFASGNAQDVTILQLQKFADFQTAEKMIDRLEQRLYKAFLMASSVQRNAERVTAEEIRFMAGELEDALGGVYSILTVDLQLKLVKGVMFVLQAEGKIPDLKMNAKPEIITGLDALSRGHDMQRLSMFLQSLQGAEAVAPGIANVIVPLELAKRLGIGAGINMTGLLKTQDQVDQENQAAQMADGMKTLGPKAMDLAGKLATSPQAQPTQQP